MIIMLITIAMIMAATIIYHYDYCNINDCNNNSKVLLTFRLRVPSIPLKLPSPSLRPIMEGLRTS